MTLGCKATLDSVGRIMPKMHSLRTVIKKQGDDWTLLVRIVKKVVRLLAKLHAAGLFHGSINTKNIVLLSTGDVALAYSEVDDAKPRSAAQDVYAIGVVLFKILCGPSGSNLAEARRRRGVMKFDLETTPYLGLEPPEPFYTVHEWPDAVGTGVLELMRQCTEPVAADRLSMFEVYAALNVLLPEEHRDQP